MNLLLVVVLVGTVWFLGPLSVVHAHTGGDGSVRPVLDPVPEQLDGVTVQLGYSAAHQLVLSNPTSEPVEILDTDGVPFLSIGPEGVLGNLNARAWYSTNDPFGQTPVPREVQERPDSDPPPRWGRVSEEPSWGWFDHRLHPATPLTPPEVVEAGVPVDLRRWVVPVRYRGQTLELTGRIRYQPLRGGFRYRLAPGGNRVTPADGVEVALLEGRDVPGLFLSNASGREVVVLGRDGEPFLRFGPAGVEANRLSPQWVQMLRDRGEAPPDARADPGAPPEWVVQTGQHAFPWPEPRGSFGAEEPSEDVVRVGVPVDVLEWEVPILVGGERHVIEGVTQWMPKDAMLRQHRGEADEPDNCGLSPTALRGELATLTIVALAAFEVRRRHSRERPETEIREREKARAR